MYLNQDIQPLFVHSVVEHTLLEVVITLMECKNTDAMNVIVRLTYIKTHF